MKNMIFFKRLGIACTINLMFVVYAFGASCLDPTIMYKEDFTYEMPSHIECGGAGSACFEAHKTSGNPPLGISSEYKNPTALQKGKDECTGSNSLFINDGMWGVVTNSNFGGYWGGTGIVGHTGNQKQGATDPITYMPLQTFDGFLLVNCSFESAELFNQVIDICPGVDYDFSAWAVSICDGKGSNAPIKLNFEIWGIQNGSETKIGEKNTGEYNQKTWKQFGFQFNSGTYTQVRLIIRNSLPKLPEYQKSDDPNGATGNDVGIDDITFSACVPSINLYSNGTYTQKDIELKNCEKSTKLYINTTEIQKFFKGTAYFQLQSSVDKKTWTNEGGVVTTSSFDIKTGNATHKNGRYYRLWVGGSQKDVEDAANNGQSASISCSVLTAVSNPIRITYSCPCITSDKPTPSSYSKCPATTGNGTLDLTTLVPVSYLGTYKWYSDENATSPLSNTVVDVKTVGKKNYYVTFTSSMSNYCESEAVPVVVEVMGGIQFDVTPKDITTCLYQGAPLTYTAKATSPSGVTFKWQDESKKQLGTGATYTLPATPGKGTITVVASDPAGKACDAEKDVTYNLTPVNKFTLKAAPVFVCSGNPESTITATVTDGTGTLVIYKGDTEKKRFTVTAADKGKDFSYTDTSVGTTAGEVTYKAVFGTGDCKDEQTTKVTVGTEVVMPITSDAEDNRVCAEDKTFTLTAGYTLKSGETLEWSKGGTVIPGESGTVLKNQKIDADTKYTVRLVGSGCKGEGEIQMYADSPVKPQISATETNICKGTKIDITNSDVSKATKYLWEVKTSGGYAPMAGQTDKDIKGYAPEETATYRLTVENGKCNGVSNEVKVTVNPPIDIVITESEPICEGGETTLTMKVSGQTPSAKIGWYEGTTKVGDGLTATVKPMVTTVYTAKVEDLCNASKTTTVTVEPKIVPTVSEDRYICYGDKVKLEAGGGKYYEWSPAETLDDAKSSTPTASPLTTTEYTVKISTDLCNAEAKTTVNVSPLPEIAKMEPYSICVSNPTVTIVAKVKCGEIPYVWYKDGAEVDRGTVAPGQTTLEYTDNNVAATATTVKYSLTIGTGTCSATEETTVTLTDYTTIPISSNVADDRICAGDLFNLTASYKLVGSEWLKWEKDGEVLTEKGTKLTGETIDKSSVLYKVTLMDGQCDGGGEITMYSDAPANPVIDASDKNICKGSVINLTDDDTSAATKYKWECNTGSGYKVMEGRTSKNIMAYAPEETATYRLTVENGVCTRTSNEVTVKVNPPIEFKVSADQSICSGDSAVLVMSGYPATATVGWYNGSEQISESDKVMVKPTQTTVYTAKVVDVCTASKNSTVNVEPAIEYTITPDGDICVGESRQLEVTGGKYYSWSPASSLDDATSATPKATPRTTTTYEVAITTDLCSTKARTTVRVHPLPIIESIENGEQGEVVVTVKSGTEPYYYSLNGKEFVDSNIFTGLTIGAHMMYVKDSATCKTEQMFEVPPVPVIPDVFFSPNDDGLYDLWTVKNLNFYSEYKVEIYDRYGRRLLSFGKGGYSGEHNDKDFIGWDGYYNGHQMPSGDYWYIITVEEIRKQFTGHFTLKR